MITKPFILLTLFFPVAFLACNKATPGGFWKNYKSQFLLKNISDQGPYGGHRAMYWKTGNISTFNSQDIIDFATKNGWTFVDSIEFSQDKTNKWNYDNKKVFPLTSTGFVDTLILEGYLTDFPRWFGGQLKVYKFKTGWVTIQPGTDNSTEENGFILLNREKTKMAVYHLWGE